MSATVLAFRDHHFTVLDSERLDSLSLAMIDIGAWERVFHVAIERRRNGTYWLIDCTTMHPMVSAKTLGPVLSLFEDIGDTRAL